MVGILILGKFLNVRLVEYKFWTSRSVWGNLVVV